MLIEDVEKLVEDYYSRVQITPAQQDALAGMLHHEFDRLMAAETEELERLTTSRDRLESEQDRLMQAHYADAIPLTVLKREQDRIVAELDKVTRRIDAHFGDYADARAHLDDALGLLANCADIYARCDDTNRRPCNQAFFTKVFIDEDNELRVEHNRPFEMLLDPQVNANALTWAADMNKARTSANASIGKGSSLVRAVGRTGRFCHPPRALKTLIKRGKEGILHSARPTSTSIRADVRGPVTQSVGKAVTRLSEDQISQLVREYMDGDQVSALAARYGIHRVTVSEHLRRRNVPTRIKGLLPSEAEASAVLYEEGYSLASIGKHFGVTANTIRNALLNSGTRLRGPNDLQRGAVPTMWLSTHVNNPCGQPQFLNRRTRDR